VAPDTFKLHTERVASPTRAKMDMTATRTVFFDAWSDYSMNRMRAQGSGVVFG
jgi:hypothetical protein